MATKSTKKNKNDNKKKRTFVIAGIIVAIPLIIISIIHTITFINNKDWVGTYDWAKYNELVFSKKNRGIITVDIKPLGGCEIHGLTNEDKEVRGCTWSHYDAVYGGNPSIKMIIDFGSKKEEIIVKRYYNELQQMH